MVSSRDLHYHFEAHKKASDIETGNLIYQVNVIGFGCIAVVQICGKIFATEPKMVTALLTIQNKCVQKATALNLKQKKTGK